ncbi:MAG TPA: hypothetical protein PJ986_18650 [Gammaproteobacteria bacterium]|nr:hypothetical protein [Gammaproteobacteria bacterium]
MFAVTGGMRLVGMHTPVPSRMRVLFIAAAAITTKGSAATIWLSSNRTVSKPSASARTAVRQLSAALARPRAKRMLNSGNQ